MSDLAVYPVKERPAGCAADRLHEVCGMGPPSSGGLAVGRIPGMLAHYDLCDPGAAETWRLIGDASRLAFADRDRCMAESDFVPVPGGGSHQSGVPGRARCCGAPPETPARSAPPRRAKTPGSIDTGGANARRGRSDDKCDPCGRLREARAEPGARRVPRVRRGRSGDAPSALARTGARAAAGAMRPGAAFGLRGLGGGPARMSPVTTRQAIGCAMGQGGSDRRLKRPCGQWRQGDC